MNLIVFISSIILVQAYLPNGEVIINGVHNQIEVLYNNNFESDALHVDYKANHLYFRYNRDIIIQLNLNTKEIRDIKGVGYPNDLTIDHETQDVYIATTQGIYKYSSSTNILQLVGAAGVNVWNVFFKGVLYYIEYNTNTIYSLSDGQSTEFVELDVNTSNTNAKRFFIDDDNIIYFSYDSVLYRQRNGKKAILYHADFVSAIAKDRNGKLYFSTSGGIYELLKNGEEVKFVISIDDCRGITFDDKNNLIYSASTYINRLIPSDEADGIKIRHVQVVEKIENLEQKIIDMEKKMDKKLTDILEHLFNGTQCSPPSDG